MEELVQSLKVSLANHYAFYLKAHYYHWNVTGPNFPQYHDFLENIYTEVYGVVDKIAEEIRKNQSDISGNNREIGTLQTQINQLGADINRLQSSGGDLGQAKVIISGLKGVFPRMICGNFFDELCQITFFLGIHTGCRFIQK